MWRGLKETSFRLWQCLIAECIAWKRRGEGGDEHSEARKGPAGLQEGRLASCLEPRAHHSLPWVPRFIVSELETLTITFKVLFEEDIKYHFIGAVVTETGRTCLFSFPSHYVARGSLCRKGSLAQATFDPEQLMGGYWFHDRISWLTKTPFRKSPVGNKLKIWELRGLPKLFQANVWKNFHQVAILC